MSEKYYSSRVYMSIRGYTHFLAGLRTQVEELEKANCVNDKEALIIELKRTIESILDDLHQQNVKIKGINSFKPYIKLVNWEADYEH